MVVNLLELSISALRRVRIIYASLTGVAESIGALTGSFDVEIALSCSLEAVGTCSLEGEITAGVVGEGSSTGNCTADVDVEYPLERIEFEGESVMYEGELVVWQ